LKFLQYSTRIYQPCIFALLILAITSCAPGKFIPDHEYLLRTIKVEATPKVLPEDQFKSYIIQRPNKKILGVRFHLFLYNLSNKEKNKWPHNWLRKIGEEPVVYNPEQTITSTNQLKQFLENKGYYHAEVKDTVTYRGKNAKVYYRIIPNEPYRVRSIAYSFEDTSLVSHILPDTINSLLKKGMKFDKDVLQKERVRIETQLKDQGYYRFSKEYIYYQAKINAEKNFVDLDMGIKEFVEGNPDPRTKVKNHPKYLIGKVFVYPDYSAYDMESRLGLNQPADTIIVNRLHFINIGKVSLRPTAIANANYIIPGQYYKLSDVNRTQRNLSELGLIRYTSIIFKESDTFAQSGIDKTLDCRIELTRKKLQSYQTEISGTNSAGDFGVRGNLLYQNLNLFRGAEILNMRFTGAIEALENRSKDQFTSMQEIGAEANLLFPKFFSPFRLGNFVRKYSPKTSISASFNYQSRPNYTRSIANSSFSYRWNSSQYLTHTLWPMELNYVKIYETHSSSEFIDSIRNTPLGYSFIDHLINVGRYGFELNNQAIGKSKNFLFLRFNIESAGNILNAANAVFNDKPEEGSYQVFNVPYFQYMRGDIDFRYYNIIDKQNKFVYRLYIGLGYPYGNSKTMPYVKKFFSGGPNSIRAWSTRDLGPGSYVESDTTGNQTFNFLKKNGDIKLEANLEYRSKLFWKLEGAIFLDMGNVWEIRPEVNREKALFEWNRFYKEIAVGTGFGARLDFSFFLLRFDFGIKLRDPVLPENDRWIPVFKDFSFNDLHFKFGIGYPF
jgi:outer membrane protein assembly factor BamA